jgi:hypothetical protein
MSPAATGQNGTIDAPADLAAPPAILQIYAALARDDEETGPFERLEGQRMTLLGICALLDALAGSGALLQQRLAGGLAAYLRADFPAMIAEEQDGLLSLLRARLLLGDDFDQVLRQMDDEHRHDLRQAAALAGECEALAGGLVPDETAVLFSACRAFAEQQRRHLAWEDATVLPLARGRLTAADLETWNRRSRARRATAPP